MSTVPEGYAPYNYHLRNPETDEIQPQPCRVCRQRLRTYREELQHDMQHAQEGRLLAVLSSLTVHFETVKEVEDSDRMRSRFGGTLTHAIALEHLDIETNAVRVVCPVCDDFLYTRWDAETGQPTWMHYPRMRPVLAPGGRAVQRWTTGGEAYRADHEVPIPLPVVVERS